MNSAGKALANLTAWLATMRQVGGYGGPVPHWWGSSYRYAGPAMDWRYEGLLAGFAELWRRTGQPQWRQLLVVAATDVVSAQREDGSLLASQFEANPGSLGTPHEAACAAGLLTAARALDRPDWVAAAGRILDNLVANLWDGEGFTDRPHVPGRVPNKLATLAEALLLYVEATGSEQYVPLAEAALRDVLRLQVKRPAVPAGAVHQQAGRHGGGDGRFFPYYNARVVAGLVTAARVLGVSRYQSAAEAIGEFLAHIEDPDGSFPQVVYEGWKQAPTPRWVAGTADILRAFYLVGRPPSASAIRRVWDGQLTSGGFRSAEGFGGTQGALASALLPDYRDVTPAVGWSDKVLRWMAETQDIPAILPSVTVTPVVLDVLVRGRPARWRETAESFTLVRPDASGRQLYRWQKRLPWAAGDWEVLAG